MMLGGIWFTNTGTSPCYLAGPAGVRLLNTLGKPLDVQAGELRQPQPDATVTLEPGVERGARVTVVWVNWCGNATPLIVQVVLPQSGGVLPVTDKGFHSRPRCGNPSVRSAISIGHFERANE